MIRLSFFLALLFGTLLRLKEYHFQYHQQRLFLLFDNHPDPNPDPHPNPNPHPHPNQVTRRSIHQERLRQQQSSPTGRDFYVVTNGGSAVYGPLLNVKSTQALKQFELEQEQEQEDDEKEKDEEEQGVEGDQQQQRQQREEARFFQSVLVNATNTISDETIAIDEIIQIQKDEQQQQQQQQPINITTHHNDSHYSTNNDDDSFSACILWMDDNHRLEEWLAYHYYIMKLRYVVINIDPFSRTSPQAIVDRWNDIDTDTNTNRNDNSLHLKLNMTIVTMTDREYLPNYQERMQILETERLSTASDQDYQYGKVKTEYHRYRQRRFYHACSQHLMEHNKSWTSYYDTDEFLTFAHEDGKKHDITRQNSHKMEQPGYILHRLNAIKQQFPPDLYVNETGLSCLTVPRRRYCAKKLESQETRDLFSSSSNTGGIIPEDFMMNTSNNTIATNTSTSTTTNDEDFIDNAKKEAIVWKFDTLRYKYLTKGWDGSPKSIIDLSQQNPQQYIQDQWKKKKKQPQTSTSSNSSSSNSASYGNWGVHYAMTDLCRKESKNRAIEVQRVIREERFELNHYLGSWEYYSFRNDARQGGLRTYKAWHERSTMTNNGEQSIVVRPWLPGFITLVGGTEVASYLLQDAGKFPEEYDANEQTKNYNTTYNFNKNHQDKKKKKKQRKKKKKKR